MMRQSTTVPTTANGLSRHHFQRAQSWIAGIVEQHGDILVELLRKIEAALHMKHRIAVAEFDPRNAADHVGAKRHRLVHEIACPGSRTMPS